MIWLLLYIAAMFLIALPVAWFGRSRIASAVFLVWGVGQILYQIGLPEPETQAAIYAAACIYTGVSIWRRPQCWRFPEIIAAIFFIPLFRVTVSYTTGEVTGDSWWWAVYILAALQVTFLTRPLFWKRELMDWLYARMRARGDGLFRIAV